MGAWGVGHFDNDDALDWASELAAAPDLSVLEDALRAVAEMGDEYLEAPEACRALAAAEVAAALRGAGAPGLPDGVSRWVARRRPAGAGLASLALQAVRRVRSNSELKELWQETESAGEWNAAVSDLEQRLAGAQ